MGRGATAGLAGRSRVAAAPPRLPPSPCPGWPTWCSPARAPWTCCPCSACASSCCTTLPTSPPPGRRRRRARAESRRPRSGRWAPCPAPSPAPAPPPPPALETHPEGPLSLQRQQKQRQLLGRLQDLLLGPRADEQTTCEVLDYFLRRLGSSQVASRVLATKVRRPSGPPLPAQPCSPRFVKMGILAHADWILADSWARKGCSHELRRAQRPFSPVWAPSLGGTGKRPESSSVAACRVSRGTGGGFPGEPARAPSAPGEGAPGAPHLCREAALARGSEGVVAPRPARVCLQGLSLVLSEGSLRDGEEKEPPTEEDSGDTDALQGYQWLLRDLPRLPLFDSVRTTTALALQQVRGRRRAAGCTAGRALTRPPSPPLPRPSTWRRTRRPSVPTWSTCPSTRPWRSRASTATWPW